MSHRHRDGATVETVTDGGRAHVATLQFSYPEPRLATAVERAVALDAGAIEGERSAASVERDDRVVTVTLDADDPRALRAAKRTWFGLVGTAERTAGLVD